MTPFQWFLAFGMLVTGSANTLTTKAADTITVEGRDGYPAHEFDHPFAQAWCMFLGEWLCLAAFVVIIEWGKRCMHFDSDEDRRAHLSRVDTSKQGFKRRILAIPACCDMTATSLMYLGLTLTYASVFQMLRGAVVIFTGIMSVLFLKRKLYGFHWLGMCLVLVGTAIVGVSSVVNGGHNKHASNPLLGNIIIVAAQVVVSFQVVVEEKFVAGYNLPALQVVGWEGTFGMLILGCVLVVMYNIPYPASATDRVEDAYDAALQISNSLPLAMAMMGNVLSIAFFNWFGISVTKHMNAATRMVLDSVRTVVIWAWGLLFLHEEFYVLQLVGFLVLLLGTVVYNDIGLRVPGMEYPPDDEEMSDPTARLLPTSAPEADSPAFGDKKFDQFATPTLGKMTAVHAH